MKVEIDKYYPIEGREDFFKYVVLKDGEIARGFQGNKRDVPMYFDKLCDAEKVCNAIKSVNSKNGMTRGGALKYRSIQVDNLLFIKERITIQNQDGYTGMKSSSGFNSGLRFDHTERQYSCLDIIQVKGKLDLVDLWLSRNPE